MIRLIPIRSTRLLRNSRRWYQHAPNLAHVPRELSAALCKAARAGLHGLLHSLVRKGTTVLPTRFERRRRLAAVVKAAALRRRALAETFGGSSRPDPRDGHRPAQRPEEERRHLAELPGPAFRRPRSPPLCLGPN